MRPAGVSRRAPHPLPLHSSAFGVMWMLCVVAAGGAAHDVVEALLFDDSECSAPLGRMVARADAQCRCLECAVFSHNPVRISPSATPTPSATLTHTVRTPTQTPSATQISPTSTPTDTLTLSQTLTETLSLTQTETLGTPTATMSVTLSATISGGEELSVNTTTPTVPNEFAHDGVAWNSSDLFPFIAAAIDPSLVCRECSLSSYTQAVAQCNSLRDSFRIRLYEQPAAFCDLDSTTSVEQQLEAAPEVPIIYNRCLDLGSVGGKQVYALLANSTCQIAPEQDKSVSGLEIAFVVLLCLFAVGAIGVAVLLYLTHQKMKFFVQLKSEAQKTAKEDKNLKKNTERALERATDTADETTKQCSEVENITGRNRFNNGLCDAAIGVPPPALPLREELNHLAAKMAHVEAELHLQTHLQRDAML
eukprot:TRINITY_DN9968_c0_g1_i1.p1 TRINITY_DN9968_c0_g1~~TRINITY_DN9968_c0_g1_i1.p1  ORF type:complete len:420 (+),score=80.87 TRINITY_DN9968_c0_g1_i1:210-1469(+)